MSKPTTIDDFSFLSDEDVKLLYEIISIAEASSARPFQALFAAYDQVLARYKIAKDNDQVYFRFLLHMGEGKKEGEGLFERFESLLEKLGLQIAFVDEREERQRNKEVQDNGAIITTAPSGSNRDDSRRLTRRVSFDSAYDTNAESRRVSGVGVTASPQRPHSTDVIHKAEVKDVNAGDKSVGLGAHRYTSQQPNGAARVTSRGRLNSRNGLGINKGRPIRKISVSQSRERQNKRRISDESKHTDMDGALSDSADDSDIETAFDPEPNMNAQLELFPQPRHTEPDLPQMEANAKTLRYHHLAANAVLIFRHWIHKASQSADDHRKLLSVAMIRDAETLKRQAFDQWRAAFQQKQHIRETDRFYENLEAKATKARDLFLLTKAFTHWAQSTSDEISRKTTARRHILQTRCFNAWREITVVNELKVRRQGLQKFMSIWKQRTAQVIRQHETAIFFCERASVDRYYRQWFWHFCERRAPTWYTSKLKRRLFGRWVDLIRRTQIMTAWAVESYSVGRLRACAQTWMQRSSIVQHNQDEAQRFHRRKLLQAPVDSMQRELSHAPLQAQIVHAVDSRITRSALRMWVDRMRIVHESIRVNDLRTKRNAWTMWNDRLRRQALSRKIDDRIVLQALYKWVLLERLALFLRIRQTKSKRSLFTRWRERMDELSASLGQASYLVRQSTERKTRASIVSKWVASNHAVQQLETTAQEYRKRHMLTEALKKWTCKWRNVQQLQDWSKDARFYVLASGSIKRWQAASITSKRLKRREAYSKLRRHSKTALARKFLFQWHDATSKLFNLQQKAAAVDHERLIRIGTTLFTTWHTRTLLLEQLQPQAEALHTSHTARHYFTLLLTRHSSFRTLTLRADAFVTDSNEALAATCLRKLNWHLFQLKRQSSTAESLADRNRKKHYRSMIRYWADRTKARRQPTARVLFQSASNSAYPTPTAPRIPVSTMDTVLATPGYLRTPSRHRTATTTATRFQPQLQQRGVATPATTHFTPFLARAQGPPLQGFRSVAAGRGERSEREGFGRSYLEVVRGSPMAMGGVLEIEGDVEEGLEGEGAVERSPLG